MLNNLQNIKAEKFWLNMQKHDCSCLNMKMCFLSLRFFKCRFGFIRPDNLQFDRAFLDAKIMKTKIWKL